MILDQNGRSSKRILSA